VQSFLPSWYYSALVLGRALNSFDRVLLFCAQKLARDVRIGSAVTGGLAYPAFMITLSIVALVVLSSTIIPQHIQTFEGMGLTVPATLQYFNYLVNRVPYHWGALLVLLPWSMSSQYLPYRTMLRLQYLKLHTPLGHLRFLEDKAMFLQMLSLLDREQLSSKLLLVNTNISGNPVIQHTVETMAALAKFGGGPDEVFGFLLKQKHLLTPYEVCVVFCVHSLYYGSFSSGVSAADRVSPGMLPQRQAHHRAGRSPLHRADRNARLHHPCPVVTASREPSHHPDGGRAGGHDRPARHRPHCAADRRAESLNQPLEQPHSSYISAVPASLASMSAGSLGSSSSPY
jgi:hypothetical protein